MFVEASVCVHSVYTPTIDEMHGACNALVHVSCLCDGVRAEADRQRSQDDGDDGHGTR